MDKFHLSGRPVDHEISRRTFHNYLEVIDPAKVYLYQSDVDEFKRYQFKLDTALKNGDLDFFYDLFRRGLQRCQERILEIDDLLSQPQDYEADEFININSESVAYAKDVLEMRERWRKRLKYELLRETTSGTKDDEARRLIELRFRDNLERQANKADDAILDLALNAFTSSYDSQSKYFSSQTWKNFLIQK